MSAIAYITDSKMLELHRLNNSETMNFWRPSINVNFSDFGVGDLVFFLSKDKDQKKNKEKGIVGFGRTKEITVSSIKSMWEKYKQQNGYTNYEDFKEAIRKVTKDHKLPRKISAFYLEDVAFFQPVYLSELDYNISNKVESYVYLKKEELVLKILSLARNAGDMWSDFDRLNHTINIQEAIYVLNESHKKIGKIKVSDKIKKQAYKYLINNYPEYRFIKDSYLEMYKIENNKLEILFYNLDNDKEIIGQALLYRYYINIVYGVDIFVRFKLVNEKQELLSILNY